MLRAIELNKNPLVKNRERERQTDRQTDREAQREKQKQRQTETATKKLLSTPKSTVRLRKSESGSFCSPQPLPNLLLSPFFPGAFRRDKGSHKKVITLPSLLDSGPGQLQRRKTSRPPVSETHSVLECVSWAICRISTDDVGCF